MIVPSLFLLASYGPIDKMDPRAPFLQIQISGQLMKKGAQRDRQKIDSSKSGNVSINFNTTMTCYRSSRL
jgi:hypothetical protein